MTKVSGPYQVLKSSSSNLKNQNTTSDEKQMTYYTLLSFILQKIGQNAEEAQRTAGAVKDFKWTR